MPGGSCKFRWQRGQAAGYVELFLIAHSEEAIFTASKLQTPSDATGLENGGLWVATSVEEIITRALAILEIYEAWGTPPRRPRCCGT